MDPTPIILGRIQVKLGGGGKRGNGAKIPIDVKEETKRVESFGEKKRECQHFEMVGLKEKVKKIRLIKKKTKKKRKKRKKKAESDKFNEFSSGAQRVRKREMKRGGVENK